MRTPLLSLVLFFTTLAAAQNDSIQLPLLVAKTAVDPFVAIFAPVIPLSAGIEAKVHDHFAVEIIGAVACRGLFGGRYVRPRGTALFITPKYYFLKKNTMHLGLSLSYGRGASSLTVEFPLVNGNFQNGSYFRRTRVSSESFSISPLVGWNGAVAVGNRFPMEFEIGPSVEFRNFHYTNLSPGEVDQLAAGKARGVEFDPPNKPVRFMILFSIRWGIVLGNNAWR